MKFLDSFLPHPQKKRKIYVRHFLNKAFSGICYNFQLSKYCSLSSIFLKISFFWHETTWKPHAYHEGSDGVSSILPCLPCA